MKHVRVMQQGNLLVLDTQDAELLTAVDKELSYKVTSFIRGAEGFALRRAGRSQYRSEEFAVYALDHKNRITCPAGFSSRLRKLFLKLGYKYTLDPFPEPKDLGRHPDCFKPYWDRLKNVEFRAGQKALFEKLVTSRRGRIACPPGFGKSFTIRTLGLLLPKARIDVVVKPGEVARTLFAECSSELPSVGIRGGGMNIMNKRIQFYCADSLHHSPGTADLLLGDEVHLLAADTYIEHLARYQYSHNFGFSATQDMRFDGKDFRLEGIFGPVIYNMSYQEAEAAGNVAPLNVLWHDVLCKSDPQMGMIGTAADRHGIWRNGVRNKRIAESVRRPEFEGRQKLILVNTTEHAVHLKKLLPEFTLVYGKTSLEELDREQYIHWGLITEDEPEMTDGRRRMLKDQFEKGTLREAIATPVWNTGVSFNNLSVLSRADGSGSKIADIQYVGRNSRISEETKYVLDYLDQFNETRANKAQNRMKNYDSQGWKQFMPGEQQKSLFPEIDDVKFKRTKK